MTGLGGFFGEEEAPTAKMARRCAACHGTGFVSADPAPVDLRRWGAYRVVKCPDCLGEQKPK